MNDSDRRRYEMLVRVKPIVLVFIVFQHFWTMSISLDAQTSGSIIALNANLRGTPSNQGIVMNTVSQGTEFEVVKEQSPWYLIQTAKFVGWVHGNGIRLTDAGEEFREMFFPPQTVKPVTTTKSVTEGGSSVFEKEYVGGSDSLLTFNNETDRVLTIDFGNVKYSVRAGGSQTVTVGPGRYEFSASVPRARPTGGVGEFQAGYVYRWRFFIVQR